MHWILIQKQVTTEWISSKCEKKELIVFLWIIKNCIFNENFSVTKKNSKCNSRIHCLHKMKAGDVPNGCGRYFMYKKINNYVDSLEIAESFIYVENSLKYCFLLKINILTKYWNDWLQTLNFDTQIDCGKYIKNYAVFILWIIVFETQLW